MGIAITLQQFLDGQNVPYEVLEHKRTGCSQRTADASHVPSDCFAKGVVVKHKDGYVLTIVPASRQVKLEEVGRWLGLPVALATEEEASTLFPDCEHGAIPPIGGAYGLAAVVDASLEGHEDIYFEGGDHQALVHVTGAQSTAWWRRCRTVSSLPDRARVDRGGFVPWQARSGWRPALASAA